MLFSTNSMRIPIKGLSIKAFTAAFLVLFLLFSAPSASGKSQSVARVVDGDTVIMADGSRVRLVGIDAPELGQPWAEQAVKQLRDSTDGRKVQLRRCGHQDKYGRVLGVLTKDGQNLNLALIERGFAIPMLIPPCGKMLLPEVLESAAGAALGRKGIYSQPEYRIVDHGQAAKSVGRWAVIRGKVLNLHRGRRAFHLNFGSDWKKDFSVVIFPFGRTRFNELGLDIGELVGREVLVLGRVREYNGPQIIVGNPDQILPLTGYPDRGGSGSP